MKDSKICKKCGEDKLLEDFPKRSKGSVDGYRGTCKKCYHKPRKRKLKFCGECSVELGRNTLDKLCESCKIKNKTQTWENTNYKTSLKREQKLRDKVSKELELILKNDCDSEIWKYIPNYENKYQASNLGRIRCLPHVFRNKNNKLISKPFYYVSLRNIRGYLQATLTNFDGISKNSGVHRWVMYAFHGESELQVDHINGVRDDNRLENLRYVTARENNNFRKDNIPDYFTSSLYGTYKQGKSWYSYIKIEGIDYYLGSYKSDLEAHTIYMKAWKEWEKLGKLPDKWVNPHRTSMYDGIDFHSASKKWRVRTGDNKVYVGIFETEDKAVRVKILIDYLISKNINLDKQLIKKVREKYGNDNRFKTPVIHTETNTIHKSISAAAKAHHISPKRLKKHLDGEIITNLNFKYKDANTTT